jgi:hypothetical protein
MQRMLGAQNLPVATTLGERIKPGSLVIMPGGPGDNHTDFANRAWGANPVTDILDHIPEIRR